MTWLIPSAPTTLRSSSKLKLAVSRRTHDCTQGFQHSKRTNPYALVVQDLDETTPVSTVEAWINTAVANKYGSIGLPSDR